MKAGDPLWLPRYAGFVCRWSLTDPQLAALFTRGTVLVPVPGSRAGGNGLWAAARLAVALEAVGLAQRLWIGLRRQVAVRKSATALSAERPSVREHFESFSVARPAMEIRRIVLVDDVVTKGRTLLAAAARLQTHFPQADIRAFALIRTLGFVEQLHQLTGRCHGVVRWVAGDARREP